MDPTGYEEDKCKGCPNVVVTGEKPNYTKVYDLVQQLNAMAANSAIPQEDKAAAIRAAVQDYSAANGVDANSLSKAIVDKGNESAESIASDVAKLGYLSWGTADSILKSNKDPKLTVVVRANMLVVKQITPFRVDPKSGSTRAGAVVMGIPEYLVHGQVTLRDRKDGTFGIYDQPYDFEYHKVNSVLDIFRNMETFVGRQVSSEGTPFWIRYDGDANVILQK